MADNKIRLVIVSSISLGIIVILLSKIYVLNRELSSVREDLGIEIANTHDLENSLSFSFENDNKPIDPELKVISEEKDSVFLRELVQRSTLFYRYHASSCFSCVMQITDIINDSPESFQSTGIVFLSDYEEDTDIDKLKEILGIEANVYCVKNLGLPIEDTHMPYFFSVNPDMTIGKFFVPIPKMLSTTMDFIESL